MERFSRMLKAIHEKYMKKQQDSSSGQVTWSELINKFD